MPPYRFQMATYFIDYDLRNSRDYQKLYDELEKFDAVRFDSNGTESRLHTLLRSLNAFRTTLIELRLIAAPANIGLSNQPKKG